MIAADIFAAADGTIRPEHHAFLIAEADYAVFGILYSGHFQLQRLPYGATFRD